MSKEQFFSGIESKITGDKFDYSVIYLGDSIGSMGLYLTDGKNKKVELLIKGEEFPTFIISVINDKGEYKEVYRHPAEGDQSNNQQAHEIPLEISTSHGKTKVKVVIFGKKLFFSIPGTSSRIKNFFEELKQISPPEKIPLTDFNNPLSKINPEIASLLNEFEVDMGILDESGNIQMSFLKELKKLG